MGKAPGAQSYERIASFWFVAACCAAAGAFLIVPSETLKNAAWVVVIAATVVATRVGTKLHDAEDQPHWKHFLRAMLFFLGGGLVAVWEAAWGMHPGIEMGASDVLTIVGYLFLFAALLDLARARTPDGEIADVIDALIIVGGLALALWIVWIGPLVSGSTLTLSERLSAIAFPLFNLTILTLLVRLTFTPGPRSRAYLLLVGAVLSSLVASQWNLLALQDGSYVPGHPLELPRMLAYVLAGLAVLHPSMVDLGRSVPGAKSMLTQPRLFMFGVAWVAAPLVFMWRWGTGRAVDPVSLIVASSFIFTLMIVRMWTLLRNIRRSEEHFRALAHNSADGTVLIGEDRKLKYVSEASVAILGYSATDLQDGDEFFDVLPGDDLEKARASFARALSEPGEKVSLEVRARRRDGSLRWLEVDMLNLLEHPSVRGVVVNFRDISERRASEERARRANESYRELFENALEGIFESRPDGSFVRANPALARMLGYESPEDLIESATADAHYVDPDQRRALLEELKERGRVDNFLVSALTRDGREISCSANVVGSFSENGDLVAMHGLVSDVTEHHRALQELRESEERFRSLVQHSSDSIVVVDRSFRITYASPSLARLVGIEGRPVLRRKLTDWFSESDTQRLETAGLLQTNENSTSVLTCELKPDHGEEVSVEVVITNMLEDVAVGGIVLNIRDVSDRLLLEKQLRHQAFHDPLTNLANRALFLDRLTHALQRVSRSNESCFVMFLDLDNFKRVNDGQGHNIGDECLRETAHRLLGCSRVSDTVARMGGDEFAILLEDTSEDGAIVLAERILQRMAEPLELPTGEVVLTPSIGIAAAAGESDAKSVLRNADVAMYLAKRSNDRQFEVFEPSMYAETVRRIEVESELRTALAQDEFDVHLQPIVDLRSGRPLGAEALVRWNHPARGLVFPGDFIEVAEETGLIVPIGSLVLRRACEVLSGWESDPSTAGLSMSVNLSAKQLRDPSVVGVVERALEEAGAEPGRLTLEITESVMAEGVDETISRLAELKQLGVQLAIDDFGTGYSSLSYLQNFPIDILKIDRSFISQLDRDADGSPLAKTIIGIGRSLGLAAVAEGVETEEQRAALADLGCSRGQGYLFAKPMPTERFAVCVREWKPVEVLAGAEA